MKKCERVKKGEGKRNSEGMKGEGMTMSEGMRKVEGGEGMQKG